MVLLLVQNTINCINTNELTHNGKFTSHSHAIIYRKIILYTAELRSASRSVPLVLP